ncbi:MAG TPA: T9SS type A sorting domain-containing protein [Bacteroidales bacterium]|nr:T9SS type A sorting domain-containing protein [Bacteroidales bacterium]
MKTLKLFLILTALMYCAKLFSQESIVFDKQYLFDNQGSYIRDVKQTSDSGYICAGAIGFDMYDERFLLFKTDKSGEIKWYKYLSNSGVHDWNEAVNIAKTGNIVTVGHTQNNSNWHDSGSIILYDDAGDTLWTKQYAFNSCSNQEVFSKMGFFDCLLPQDNSILAVGCINEEDYGTNPIIVKTNMGGDTLWTWRLYDTNNVIVLHSVAETKGGDYIAVGTSLDTVFNKNDQYPRRGVIVKISTTGEQKFFVEWNELHDCGFECISIDENGNLIIGGYNYKNPPEVEDTEYFGMIIKTDSLGNTIWKKNVAYGKSISCIDIEVDSMDEIICLNSIEPPYYENWKMDVILEKYAGNGELIWSRVIGEQTVVDWPYSLILTNDGGFAFCGLNSPDFEQNRSWLVKTDSIGNGVYHNGWINNIKNDKKLIDLELYPNPAADFVIISIADDLFGSSLRLIDSSGKLILSEMIYENKAKINLRDVNNGVYTIHIDTKYGILIRKLIVLH